MDECDRRSTRQAQREEDSNRCEIGTVRKVTHINALVLFAHGVEEGAAGILSAVGKATHIVGGQWSWSMTKQHSCNAQFKSPNSSARLPEHSVPAYTRRLAT